MTLTGNESMKIVVFGIIALLVAAVFLLLLLGSPPKTFAADGKLTDLNRLLGALAEANNADAFLIVTMEDTKDFFQFNTSRTRVT